MQSSYYIEKDIVGKEVVIDWFQVTFDFIPVTYEEHSNRYVLNKNDPKFIELIKILNPPSELIKIEYEIYISRMIDELATKKSGRYRFDNGYMLGEHIELSFGGNKTSLDTFPVILIMTGQGCREFEKSGGDWIQLFKFILGNGIRGHLKIGRLDIAIDDFDGNEITPYEIEEHIRNHNYISPFRKVNFNITEMHSLNPTTEGFAITFGSRGSNQLQIYDKNLERRANKEIDKNTNVWYRYEMRFMEDMGYTILTRYIEAFDLDTSINFMNYIKGVLKSLLDIKLYNPNNMQRSRWKTLPAWDNFLDSLGKVDIKRISKVETTIEKKKAWFKEDLATTLLQFRLIYEGDDFENYLMEVVASADFKTKHLNMVNNYFKDHKKEIIDMKEVNSVQKEFAVNLSKPSKSEDELLEEQLIRLDRRLDGFIYSGDENELNVVYLSGIPFVIEIVDGESRFDDFKNVIYFGRSDLQSKRYVFIKTLLEKRIKEIKGLL